MAEKFGLQLDQTTPAGSASLLQRLARLTLNAGKHTANQQTRLLQLDDGNDRAILVQRHEGPAQVVRLGHRATPSVRCSDEVAISSRPAHSISRSIHRGVAPFPHP